jgi:hypothetical protein
MITMDTNKIRELVKKHLSEKPRNTTEINEWMSKQLQISEFFDISAILESDPAIVRIGRVRRSGVVGKKSPLSEWATEEWVKHHERKQPKERR